MSLKVWLPLCGDLKQQGISDITATTFETPMYVDGKIGPCYQRANSNSQLTNGINLNSNLLDILGTQASIAVWIKPLGTHTHYNGTIASSGNWNAKRWAFGVSQDNTKVDVLCGSYNNYINCNIPVNEWTHLVSTFNNGTCKLYKNGEYIGQLTGQKAFETDAQNTCIARETYASGYFGFNGCINDVRIYDHCLSAAEVHEISQGLVLHYKLDDISHGIVDSSGYGHNGINTDILLTNTTQRYELSSQFNGNTSNIKTTLLGSYDNLTFSVWLNYSSRTTWFGIDCRDSSGTGMQPLYYNGSYIQSGGSQIGWKNYTTSLNTNTWYHYATTYEPDKIKIYLNGELKSTFSLSTSYTYADIPIMLGARYNIASSTLFLGNLSDFRVYCTALTADDILQLYHTSAKVDNKQNLHSFEFIEDQSKISITKRGQTTSDEFNEITSTKFKKDTTIETAQLIEF